MKHRKKFNQQFHSTASLWCAHVPQTDSDPWILWIIQIICISRRLMAGEEAAAAAAVTPCTFSGQSRSSSSHPICFLFFIHPPAHPSSAYPFIHSSFYSKKAILYSWKAALFLAASAPAQVTAVAAVTCAGGEAQVTDHPPWSYSSPVHVLSSQRNWLSFDSWDVPVAVDLNFLFIVALENASLLTVNQLNCE